MGPVNPAAAVPIADIRSVAGRVAPVAFLVAAGVLLAGRIPETAFLAIAIIVGLPHGAFDHEVGRRAFGPRHGAGWWRPFLLGYVGLVLATLLAWWTLPVVALSLFLLLSVLHFGDRDASIGAAYRAMRIVAHGGAPIIMSAACHPDVVDRVFAALAPAHAQAVTMLLGGPLMTLWVATAVGTLAAYAVRRRANDRVASADLILVASLFALAPPLIAFSLYFAAIHAPRAFAAAWRAGGIRARGMALPLILTLLGLALGTAIFVAGVGMTAGDNLVRTAFLLLSALTVPHMWLEWRARLASRIG